MVGNTLNQQVLRSDFELLRQSTHLFSSVRKMTGLGKQAVHLSMVEPEQLLQLSWHSWQMLSASAYWWGSHCRAHTPDFRSTEPTGHFVQFRKEGPLQASHET